MVVSADERGGVGVGVGMGVGVGVGVGVSVGACHLLCRSSYRTHSSIRCI